MRPITVDGLAPVRNAAMATMNSSAFWPLIFGTGVSAAGLVAWQPVQAAAPPGGSGEAASAEAGSSASAVTAMADSTFMVDPLNSEGGGPQSGPPLLIASGDL